MTKSEFIEKLQNVEDDAPIRIVTATGNYEIDSVAAMRNLVNVVIAD